MIQQWSCCALKTGGGRVERSILVRYHGAGDMIEVPYVSLAATDGVHKVIIDTGPREVDIVVKPHAHRTPDEELPAVLQRCLGWAVEDVDIVINTHLHYDHCGGNCLFPNAKIYVQKAEWEAAHNLSPSDRRYYLPSDYAKDTISYFQWEFLDGDTEILPGLRVVLAPGHSWGMQMVFLNTAEGTLCFPGDAVPSQHNLDHFIEPNIVVDAKGVYRSMELVRRYADRIVLSHEDTLQTGQTSGFPVVPPAVDHTWKLDR